MMVGVALPFTAVGRSLGFTPLPGLYWPLVAVSVVGYALLTQAVKTLLVRKKWI
jgi:Mg2+-importing ATPase